MKFPSTLSRAFAIALGVCALFGLALLIPGDVESSGLSEEGHFEYVPTTYAENSGAQCPAGLECEELCFVGPNGIHGMRQLCCVDSYGVCHGDLR